MRNKEKSFPILTLIWSPGTSEVFYFWFHSYAGTTIQANDECVELTIPFLHLSSGDNIWKQEPFDTLILLLRAFIKSLFYNMAADDKKSMKNYPA